MLSSAPRHRVEERKSFGRLYCESSSAHGFAGVASAETSCERGLWLSLIAICAAVVAYQIYLTFDRFYKDPIVTKISVVSGGRSIPFPEVTICNQNPFNRSAMEELEKSELFRDWIPAAVKVSKLGNDVAAAGLQQRYIDAEMEYYRQRFGVDNVTGKVITIGEPSKEFDPILEIFRLGMIRPSAFLLRCMHKEQLFNCSRELSEIHSNAGRCVQFLKLQPQDFGGRGLLLLLDTHADLDYATAQSEGLAVRVEAHYDFGADRRILVQPATYTRINLMANEYRMLPTSSNSSCREDMERRITNLPYSDSVCRLECTGRILLDTVGSFVPEIVDLIISIECSCLLSLPPVFRAPNAIIDGMPQCTDENVTNCRDAVLRSLLRQPSECLLACRPKCDFWEYTATSSQARFPSAALQRLGRSGDLGLDWKNRSAHIILLEIVFESLLYKRIEQVSAMYTNDFISQIGGHLGLFLGASILSLVQFGVILFQYMFCPQNIRLRSQISDSSKVTLSDSTQRR